MKRSISVIIPTKGRCSLFRCIDSVTRQTLTPEEIVIVDNSTGSHIRKIISRRMLTSTVPIKYIREPKKGASFSRNTGARHAHSPLLAFIDDDCTASKTWLKQMVDLYSRVGLQTIIKGRSENGSPEDLVSCVQHVGDEMFFRMGYLTDGKYIHSKWLDTKNALIPKSLFTKEKLKFNKYRIFEDLDFSIQALKSNIPIYYCHNAVIYHKGRSDLVPFFSRQIQKAKDYLSIKQRAQPPKKTLRFSDLEKLHFARFRQWKSEKEVRDELITPALRNKSFFFRIRFYILQKAGDLIIFLVYLMEKI